MKNNKKNILSLLAIFGFLSSGKNFAGYFSKDIRDVSFESRLKGILRNQESLDMLKSFNWDDKNIREFYQIRDLAIKQIAKVGFATFVNELQLIKDYIELLEQDARRGDFLMYPKSISTVSDVVDSFSYVEFIDNHLNRYGMSFLMDSSDIISSLKLFKQMIDLLIVELEPLTEMNDTQRAEFMNKFSRAFGELEHPRF